MDDLGESAVGKKVRVLHKRGGGPQDGVIKQVHVVNTYLVQCGLTDADKETGWIPCRADGLELLDD